MKLTIERLLEKAFVSFKQTQDVSGPEEMEIKVEHAKEAAHGDYSTNLALILAKPYKQSPLKLAEALVALLPSHPAIERVEIAAPGFINFFIKETDRLTIIPLILEEGKAFGCSKMGQGERVLVEFVSANPTGPLHVGHGRGAAFGATLANVLQAAGFDVQCEYYVNDAGRQMNILAVSVWLRYLTLAGETLVFPANGYRGEYVIGIAKTIFDLEGKRFVHAWDVVHQTLPLDEPAGGDKEIYIDALIERANVLLKEDGFNYFHQQALESVLTDIKEDLAAFGVHYDQWFSEHSLLRDGSIDNGIKALSQAGYTYKKEGALWFRSTAFGDEKDRVLMRANGQPTYFASDVAYHWNKYDRGFSKVIDIFGADHHGYITRVKAAVNALGHDETALKVLFVQFAILYRSGERVQMSTRSGSFVTLRELREEVGNDAARFFYVMRKPEQHMDFDLDLAKSTSSDNPVYYIQYAYARISSVLRQLKERGLDWDEAVGCGHLHLLLEPQEGLLVSLLSKYPEIIETAARSCEPHQLAYYLRELATGLHSYYNAIILLCEPYEQRCARLCLLKAVRQVLHNGLQLLGVSAPESM